MAQRKSVIRCNRVRKSCLVLLPHTCRGQLISVCRYVLNFIAENPQNFSQFPPVKVQFSTLDEYFTARAKDIGLQEKQQQHQPQQ